MWPVVVKVLDEAGCLFEVAPPIDPFDGVEVSTRDGVDSVCHFFCDLLCDVDHRQGNGTGSVR